MDKFKQKFSDARRSARDSLQLSSAVMGAALEQGAASVKDATRRKSQTQQEIDEITAGISEENSLDENLQAASRATQLIAQRLRFTITTKPGSSDAHSASVKLNRLYNGLVEQPYFIGKLDLVEWLTSSEAGKSNFFDIPHPAPYLSTEVPAKNNPDSVARLFNKINTVIIQQAMAADKTATVQLSVVSEAKIKQGLETKAQVLALRESGSQFTSQATFFQAEEAKDGGAITSPTATGEEDAANFKTRGLTNCGGNESE